MKTATAAIVLSALAAPALASPVLTERGQMCNAMPTARGSQKPSAQPVRLTADTCREACAATASCQCYVFGLPSGAKVPTCKLFSVPAAKCPPQCANQHVFDKTCANVPKQQPTHAHPVGIVNKKKGPRDNGSPQEKSPKADQAKPKHGQTKPTPEQEKPKAIQSPKAPAPKPKPAPTPKAKPV